MFQYIEMFYNPENSHTNNGRVSPTEYEQQYFENLRKCQIFLCLTRCSCPRL